MLRNSSVAVGVTAMGVLPSFMVSAFAVQLRATFPFDETHLGLVVGAFYGVSAGGSILAGRMIERAGSYAGIVLTAACSGAALAGVALLATSWWWVLGMLVLGGVGNASAQPAANHLLASRIPPARQGLLFGIKQAAVPVTTLVGGALVPILGLTVGWEWAFGGLAVVAVLLVLLAPRGQPDQHRRPSTAGHIHSRPALLTLTVGGLLGAAAVNSMGVFHVASGVAAGLSPGAAGSMLAMGSALGIVTRVLAGWRADFRQGGHLRVACWMLLLGAVGFVLLGAAPPTAVFVLGTVLAFGAGWGWNGLYTFAVIRRYPLAPAAASGVSQTGLWIGGLTGPPIFGVLASQVSYFAAWTTAAVALVAAAACLLVARAMYLRGDVAGGSG